MKNSDVFKLKQHNLVIDNHKGHLFKLDNEYTDIWKCLSCCCLMQIKSNVRDSSVIVYSNDGENWTTKIPECEELTWI